MCVDMYAPRAGVLAAVIVDACRCLRMHVDVHGHQVIIFALPAADDGEAQERRVLVSELPQEGQDQFFALANSSMYQELAIQLQRFRDERGQIVNSAPSGAGAEGAGRHAWFKRLTTEQQALFLAFTAETVSDARLGREALLESLGSDEVRLLAGGRGH